MHVTWNPSLLGKRTTYFACQFSIDSDTGLVIAHDTPISQQNQLAVSITYHSPLIYLRALEARPHYA